MNEAIESPTVPKYRPVDVENHPLPAHNEPPRWHKRFLELEPNIRRHAEIRFRSNPDREEAVQEVIARSLVAFVRLLESGKEDRIYASPLAQFAVAQVRSGRRVGAPARRHRRPSYRRPAPW